MINVLLVCTAGISTSLLLKKIELVAQERKIDMTIKAIGEAESQKENLTTDVMLLGPQVRYLERAIKKINEKSPMQIAAVDESAYSNVDGDKVVDQILELAKK